MLNFCNAKTLCLFCLMSQEHRWHYFAFNQFFLANGKIAPEVLLPHDAKYNTRFYMSGSGLDWTHDFQTFCGSGLDRIQFCWIRTGIGLKNFTVRSSLVCSVIIFSTISWVLRTVAAVFDIIHNIRWWWWALLCCVEKLPNFCRDQSMHKNTTAWKCRKIRIVSCEKSRFYPVLANIRIENPDKPKIFIKKNVRNHSHHQIYPVLAKIRINRGLLYAVVLYCTFH